MVDSLFGAGRLGALLARRSPRQSLYQRNLLEPLSPGGAGLFLLRGGIVGPGLLPESTSLFLAWNGFGRGGRRPTRQYSAAASSSGQRRGWIGCRSRRLSDSDCRHLSLFPIFPE